MSQYPPNCHFVAKRRISHFQQFEILHFVQDDRKRFSTWFMIQEETKMRKGCFINNTWVETAEKLAVLSPWSGETVGEVSLAAAGEWEAAIAAAQKAFVTFKNFSSLERQQMLEKLAAGVKARQEELAQTIVAEGGKPIAYARGEMARGVLTLSLAAQEAARIGGEVIPLDLTPPSRGRWGITRRFPLGPVLGISPFNFPFNLVAHKVGPALAGGQPHHHQARLGHPVNGPEAGGDL